MSSVRAARVTGALTLVGVGALVALAALAAQGSPGALVPSVLPAAFLIAGGLGGRARPDHRGVQLLLAVGSLHLLAFALSGWLGESGARDGLAWVAALLAVAAYGAGFVALAVLLAAYPAGRPAGQGVRIFRDTCVVLLLLCVTAEVLLRETVPLVLEGPWRPVPAPAGIPLARMAVDPGAPLPLLVVAGAVVLGVRARRASAAERRQLEWAVLAGGLLALLLLATPAAVAVLPDQVWTVVFLASMCVVPFALLGGLVQHRLLDVDVLATRTLARGAMVVLVLSCYALAAAAVDGSGRWRMLTAVGLTLAAALTGQPLLRRLEALTDRWVAGGRVGRGALVDELGRTLTAGSSDLPLRVCSTLCQAFDAGWMRLVVGAQVVAATGTPDTTPALTVDLVASGSRVGVLEAGPRRGGWGPGERRRLQRLAPQVALALQERELSRQLAARVDELIGSRARLVVAEETVRRQVERDLHDGAQQQLVALLASLSLARELLGPATDASPALAAAHELAQTALSDLRRLVAGIHPALLGDRGLVAAVEARVAALPLVVTVDADPRIADVRFLPEVEGAAYFVVCEAVTNVMKHSGSPRARVVVAPRDDGGLRVAVTDEGHGRASADGSGLAGLRDRVEALGGRFEVQSVPDVGTTVVAEFTVGAVLAGSDA